MSKYNKNKNNFKHGEISSKLYGRKELEEYKHGARLIENFVPRLTGGLDKRGGTEFVVDVTNMASGSDRGPAVYPFIVSKTESYVMAIRPEDISVVPFGLRIFRNDGVEMSLTSTTTIANPPAGTDPMGFNFAQIGDVMFLTHSAGEFRPLIISKDPIISTLFKVDDMLTVDLSTLLNPNLGSISEILRTPYRDVNITPITLTPSALTGVGITITASASFFNVGQERALLKITHGTTTGVVKLKTFGSPTTFIADVIIDFSATTASDNWQEGSWSDYRGYPKNVAAFEQRLIWGGNKHQPDTLWISLLGNVFHLMARRLLQDVTSGSNTSGINYFIPSAIPDDKKIVSRVGELILPDDPFSITIASQEVNPITWMSSGRRLLIGTLGAEYVAGAEDKGFGIETATLRQQTNYGGSPRRPVRASNEVMFLMRDGARLRTFKFNEQNGSYISANISLTAEHLVELGDGEIFSEFDKNYEYLDMVHQPSKDIIWMINSRGRLVGLSFSRENENIAWFRTDLPLVDNVWGVTSIPDVTGGNDDVYMIVERDVGGKKFYLEKIAKDFDAPSLNESPLIDRNIPVFLDSSVILDNTAGATISTITGLTHLIAKEVFFVYSGVKQGPFIVDGAGEITLTTSVSVAGIGVTGIFYGAAVELLDLDAGADFESSEGQIQRQDRAVVRFERTRQAKVGTLKKTDTVNFKHADAQALASGQFRNNVSSTPGLEQILRIESTEPQPCTILGVSVRGKSYDGGRE